MGDLERRLLFPPGALVVFRIGPFIPVSETAAVAGGHVLHGSRFWPWHGRSSSRLPQKTRRRYTRRAAMSRMHPSRVTTHRQAGSRATRISPARRVIPSIMTAFRARY